MVVTARQDASLAEAMRQADMATPDGAPIAWMLCRLGFPNQPRTSGRELMRAYLAQASQRAEPIFLSGTPEALAARKRSLMAEFPALVIAGASSPPFRPLTEAEDEALVAQINASGARTVWVGLGCPGLRKMDAGAPRPGAGGHAGCRGGVRLHFRHQAARADLDAKTRARMAAPGGKRAGALVAALSANRYLVGHRRGSRWSRGGSSAGLASATRRLASAKRRRLRECAHFTRGDGCAK